jgi:hypothetical protein
LFFHSNRAEHRLRTDDRSQTAERSKAASRNVDHTVQQIADLFSLPCTTVYGYLDTTSKGKRPVNYHKSKNPADAQPTEASPSPAGLNASGGW